ncbi:fimbrial protein [Cupriavidus basilensis]|uniref:Putative fimbrial protein n=1 Tax=Cupriavidus basilensis TaxID=68895 RepID=A0A0C4Y3N0_9BURK|nr:fimbrial protein [Cupriavidus basilensis]AJG19847.1 putative fimbrial protein [Cupriavidus basilensis]
MNTNVLPIAGQPGAAGGGTGGRQSVRLFLAVPMLMLGLGLGLASGGAQAQFQNRTATNCTNPNPQEIQPWTVTNPLTSSTAIGTILMERRFALETSFTFGSIPLVDAHELVTGAHWTLGFGPPVGADGLAPTNIDGIGFKWEALSSDGVTRTLRKELDPLAVEKMDVLYNPNQSTSIGATIASYKQYLVLTKDPNALPAGEIKVTSVAGGLQVKIYAADFLKSVGVSLGSTFQVPTLGLGCRQSITYDSTGIVGIGGGPPPPILNRCDVVANQIIPVDLGSIPIDRFKRLNDTSPPKHFEIALSNCAANARPTISFRDKAMPPNADKTVLRLSAPGGQSLAQGFGIIMTREDGSRERISYGDPGAARKYEMTLDKLGRTAKLPLSAQYIRTGGDAEVKAGYAGGSAEFTFTFP